MPAALKRQQQSEQNRVVQINDEPKYQEFTALTPQHLQLEDVLFFARIATFAISTVLICFGLLAQGIATILSFSLALTLSLGVVWLLSKGLAYWLRD